MKRNAVLKKIRKATRRNRVESFQFFWEEIEETGFWMRLAICWEIIWRRRIRNRLQKTQEILTQDAIAKAQKMGTVKLASGPDLSDKKL